MPPLLSGLARLSNDIPHPIQNPPSLTRPQGHLDVAAAIIKGLGSN